MVLVVMWTIFALLFIALFAGLGFLGGRFPKPTTSRFVRVFGMIVGPQAWIPVSHMPWSWRVTTLCVAVIAIGVAWYFGARDRSRDGFPAFAHAPYPEGHSPTWRDRAKRVYTPKRGMAAMVALVTYMVLFAEGTGTRSEREARARLENVETQAR